MVGGIICERWATSFRNDGRLRPESTASGYDWCNEAIVGGSEQLVTAVLSGLEPQPGAVPVRVLWPHGIGALGTPVLRSYAVAFIDLFQGTTGGPRAQSIRT